jgi:hypothetical protein
VRVPRISRIQEHAQPVAVLLPTNPAIIVLVAVILLLLATTDVTTAVLVTPIVHTAVRTVAAACGLPGRVPGIQGVT